MNRKENNMGTEKKEKSKVLKFISTTLSNLLIGVLIVLGILLLYYFACTKLYAKTGDEKYVPAFSLYTIISPSMIPNINVYDVVVNLRVKDADDLKVGDVITFKPSFETAGNLTVTHRINQRIEDADGKIKFVTKGDNNPSEDSGYVYEEDLEGRTIFKIPQLGKIQFLIASRGGWFLIILLPAFAVIVYDIIKIFKAIGARDKLQKIADKTEEMAMLEEEKKRKRKEEFLKRKNELEGGDSNEEK